MQSFLNLILGGGIDASISIAWVGAGSYIVEFNMPAYLGLYPSFLVAFPYPGPRA